MQFKVDDEVTLKYAYKKLEETAKLLNFNFGLFKCEDKSISNLYCDMVYVDCFQLNDRNRLDNNITAIIKSAKDIGANILEEVSIRYVRKLFLFKVKVLRIRFIKIEGVEYSG